MQTTAAQLHCWATAGPPLGHGHGHSTAVQTTAGQLHCWITAVQTALTAAEADVVMTAGPAGARASAASDSQPGLGAPLDQGSAHSPHQDPQWQCGQPPSCKAVAHHPTAHPSCNLHICIPPPPSPLPLSPCCSAMLCLPGSYGCTNNQASMCWSSCHVGLTEVHGTSPKATGT